MRLKLARRRALSWPPLGRLATLALAALAFSAVISACSLSSASQQVDETRQAEVEDAWGFRVIGVSLTAAGGMIDLRYQVTNPEKAALALGGGHGATTYEEAIEDVKESPLLIDEASGYALTETHLHLGGRLHKQRLEPKAGLTRYILFGNTGGLIERGSKVSLAIGDGDLRLEHLEVQ